MCTVTIIPTRDGFRLATNRDERRTRPAAIPPSTRLFGERHALSPTDPLGGGTWVAATETGMVFTVLNGNPFPMPSMPPKEHLVSRGLIIPSIASAPSISGAVALTENLPLERLAPFRLVVCDGRTIVEAWWAREQLSLHRRDIAPSCWVSSGLGDHLVQARHPLFKEMVADAGATPDAQDAFHTHRWPDNPRVSVLMEREDARTVSRTVVELVKGDSATMRYTDDRGVVVARLSLSRADSRIEQAARRTT
jgi:hypothetical protein